MNIFYAIIMSMEEDEAAIKKETIMFQARGQSAIMTEFQAEFGQEGNGQMNIFNQIQNTETESNNTQEQERKKAARNIDCYFRFRDIFNGLFICLSCVVLCIDYEGQPR